VGKPPKIELGESDIVGLLLFLTAKISVIRKRKISFGTGLMSEGMANLYRVGYWLMIVGILVTFT
jgi:hypothetical protein